jgi:hypothetical protein
VERPEKKPAVLQRFLEGAEPRIGASNESVLMKGAHGYIRGYSGIGIADGAHQVLVVAEAQGSGSESGHFPDMPDKPDETMQRLTGNKEPLSDAIVEGDTGYFSEHNLRAVKQRGIETFIPDQQCRTQDVRVVGRT